jgi:hypothetical protein
MFNYEIEARESQESTINSTIYWKECSLLSSRGSTGSGVNMEKNLVIGKRGWLKVASFGRSRFKLLTLKFLNKSVQAASCERLKTNQRRVFLLFE